MLRLLFQVELQFVIEFVLDGIASEEGADAQGDRVNPVFESHVRPALV
jgi:hypothetical protein